MHIPHLREAPEAYLSTVEVKASADGLLLHQKASRAPGRFCLRTNAWYCPYGLNEARQLIVPVPPTYLARILALDEWARERVRENYEILTDSESEPPVDDDELPFSGLIRPEGLKLQLSDRTRTFDCNGERLPDDESTNVLSGSFTGYFLLDLSAISTFKGHIIWQAKVLQIRIKTYSTLPEGCMIYNTEEEVLAALHQRTERPLSSMPGNDPDDDTGGIPDYGLDVNELL